MATYTLSPAEFALTVEKLAKVNERAERKGFTGRVSVSGRTETRKDDFGYTYAVVVVTAARINDESERKEKTEPNTRKRHIARAKQR